MSMKFEVAMSLGTCFLTHYANKHVLSSIQTLPWNEKKTPSAKNCMCKLQTYPLVLQCLRRVEVHVIFGFLL